MQRRAKNLLCLQDVISTGQGEREIEREKMKEREKRREKERDEYKLL